MATRDLCPIERGKGSPRCHRFRRPFPRLCPFDGQGANGPDLGPFRRQPAGHSTSTRSRRPPSPRRLRRRCRRFYREWVAWRGGRQDGGAGRGARKKHSTASVGGVMGTFVLRGALSWRAGGRSLRETCLRPSERRFPHDLHSLPLIAQWRSQAQRMPCPSRPRTCASGRSSDSSGCCACARGGGACLQRVLCQS
jgi:hypothetical protein